MFQKSWPFFFSFFFLPFPHLKKYFRRVLVIQKKEARGFSREMRDERKNRFSFFFVFNIFSVCVCVYTACGASIERTLAGK